MFKGTRSSTRLSQVVLVIETTGRTVWRVMQPSFRLCSICLLSGKQAEQLGQIIWPCCQMHSFGRVCVWHVLDFLAMLYVAISCLSKRISGSISSLAKGSLLVCARIYRYNDMSSLGASGSDRPSDTQIMGAVQQELQLAALQVVVRQPMHTCLACLAHI